MNKEPLVSVAVISYNSEKTIIETLDSIKNQTYSNIELIISDDCSNDLTISITEDWIDKNKRRFQNVHILTSETNTGVTKNCNRAYKIASGEFIKDIAADDILLPNYLEDCINFFLLNPKTNILYSKVKNFKIKYDDLPNSNPDYSFFDLKSYNEQFNYIKKFGVPVVPTPSVIYRSSVFKNHGYFDERIPMWEDGPMTFKLIEEGEVLFLLDKIGVMIRVRDDSISHSCSINHKKSISLFYKYYLMKYDSRFSLKTFYHKLKMFLLYHSDINICNILYRFITFNKD